MIWRPISIRYVVLTIAFRSISECSFSQTKEVASPPSCIVHLTLVKRCPGTSDDVDNTINAIAQTSVGLELSDSIEVPKREGFHDSMVAKDIVNIA